MTHGFSMGKYVFHIMPYNAVEGEVFGRTWGTEQIEISIDGDRVALPSRERSLSPGDQPGGVPTRLQSVVWRQQRVDIRCRQQRRQARRRSGQIPTTIRRWFAKGLPSREPPLG